MENSLKCNKSDNGITYRIKENLRNVKKYAVDPITAAIVFLICSAALYIVVSSTINFYTAYSTIDMQKQAVQKATNNGDYIDIKFSSKAAIGFNITKGIAPSIINGSSDISTQVIVKPRNSTSEYYRYPDGTIAYPYSLPVEEY
ncbi:Uncharacterised protein [Clostridium putrefaciens]|uniref:Uncharacterized protein n=1 Tax=Clostridium putrefaciens TaxID=99675 RepID=A0A381JB85_9CLOT|nr:hypothetical protein [Clostridium putrefaciens]SUY47657.1 Uncharacterised protein [Clostridium putrefaciens]